MKTNTNFSMFSNAIQNSNNLKEKTSLESGLGSRKDVIFSHLCEFLMTGNSWGLITDNASIIMPLQPTSRLWLWLRNKGHKETELS